MITKMSTQQTSSTTASLAERITDSLAAVARRRRRAPGVRYGRVRAGTRLGPGAAAITAV
jgi:hypothetical protein